MSQADVPAVLILGFNRPRLLKDLISELRVIAPSKVYVSIDGPRSDVPGDDEAVLASQEAARAIDWTDQVNFRFLRHNVGCGRAVNGGLAWFFSNVEEGIILEDDVRPSRDFYRLCSSLLDKYRNVARVGSISGNSYVPLSYLKRPNDPYRFSLHTNVWGWATWRRTYERYAQLNSSRLPEFTFADKWRAMDRSVAGFAYYSLMNGLVSRGKVDTWDVQWNMSQMLSGDLTAVVNINQVHNLGFDQMATHTTSQPTFIREPPAFELNMQQDWKDDIPLLPDIRADRWTSRQLLRAIVERKARIGLHAARRITGITQSFSSR